MHGLPADFLTRNHFNLAGFLGIISAAALWQIAYAPYVSDYSRYMPHDTGARPAFWASYWGCTLGSFLPMVLGAAVGLAAPSGNLMAGLALLTRGIAPLVLIVFSVGVAAANAMNLYCGALSTLTFGQTLMPRWSPGPRARTLICLVLFALSLIGALLGKKSFLVNYEDFILLLLYVLVPWTAINLVDYYLLRHGRYDVASFFRRDGGIYGRINSAAVTCYAVGILVQLPFICLPDLCGSGRPRHRRHRFVLDRRLGGDLAGVLLAREALARPRQRRAGSLADTRPAGRKAANLVRRFIRARGLYIL